MSNILHKQLTPIRRQWWLLGIALGTTWAMIAGIVLLLFSGWLDLVWELPPEGRIACLAGAFLLGGTVFALFVIWTTRNGRLPRLARRVDRSMNFGGAVLTGCELDETVPTSSLSAGLARMAVEHAAALARTAVPGQVVSAKPARRSLIVAVSLGGFIGLLFLLMPDLMNTQRLRFLSPYADVPRFSKTTIEIEEPEKSVLYGDPLDIRAVVRGDPVDAAELVLEDGNGVIETVPMFPETSDDPTETRWRASLAKVTEPAVYHVRADRSRSTKHSIEVTMVPRIENVRFRIEPPPYTNRSAYEGPLPKEGVSGLPGTKVTIWATSNRPLSRGEITLTKNISAGSKVDHAEESIHMVSVPMGTTEVGGEFTVTCDGKFEIRIFDETGLGSRETFSGAITLLRDERPMIRIVKPPPRSLATPSVTLPVQIYAEDDYGISQIRFFRSLNDSRFLPMSLSLPGVPPRRFSAEVELPLTGYDLKPGDAIKLFARVEDTDPAGPKGAESSVVLVEIISQEDFEQMVRSKNAMELMLSRYREALRRLEALAEETEELQKELEGMNPDDPASEAVRGELEKLARMMDKEAEAIRKLAENPLPYDLDKELSEELDKAAKMAEDAAKAVKKMAEQTEGENGLSNKAAAEELAELAEKLAAGRKSLDEATMPDLELLAAVLPLKRDEGRFVQLVQKQKDLAERLSSLKGRDREDDPAMKARMRELEDEQRELREALDELLRDIEEHARMLPDEPQFEQLREEALVFADFVRASRADPAMSEAQTGLSEYSGTIAYDRATEAAEVLESFLNKCNGMGQCASKCLGFRPGMAACMNSTMQQLLRDMSFGFGTGSGGFGGSGSGYGAQRGGGNVGLYGMLPGMASFYDSRSDGRGGASMYGKGGTDNATESDAAEGYETTAEGTVGGAAEGNVPLRYRQAVGRYFQRILEESD